MSITTRMDELQCIHTWIYNINDLKNIMLNAGEKSILWKNDYCLTYTKPKTCKTILKRH